MMLTKDEILKKAQSYDFEAVMEYLEDGGDPAVYNGYGMSLLTITLKAYYDKIFFNNPDEVAFMDEHEFHSEYYEHVNKFIRIPLEDRSHAIREQIDYLIGKGISINDVGWKEAEENQKTSPFV